MEASGESLKKTIAGYWDGRSEGFERMQGIRSRQQREKWTQFLASTVGEAPKRVLDVGTGTGFLALLLAGLGHGVKGLDLSPGMVEQARRNAVERGLAAEFAVGDAESLPEPDAAYDVLVNRNVLWTLPHPEAAVADWQRVLKPGGLVVVIDGDWFDAPFSYRAKRFLGHLLVAATRFENLWAVERKLRQGYDGGFGEELPLKGPGNRQKFPRLLAAAGFVDVQLRPMPQVDRAEKAGWALAKRLNQPHEFFAVVARKP
ncbi:MAG TPA: methyltransferase domain-containing protein [Thermoanaerobaculia bacterium]|jgi:ubiquinone/menaquinone biosynthesis C-methylase UbiE|nr:methyltransferase domain-containing protein [Thermoanaerobaculia bacterium]